MEKAPRVSVIIPTYNRARLLPRAVQSVLEQDYRDFEIIVIDDGSTDDTPQVMLGHADPRIRYVRYEENRGIGFGRSEGVRLSRGELIAFNDSDDAWLPGKLTEQVAVFDRYPEIDLLFSDFWNINQISGQRELGFEQATQALSGLRVERLGEGLHKIIEGYPRALLTQSFMATPTVVFRKELVTKVGTFHTGLSGPEDFEFWWRSAVKGAKFAYLAYPLIERYKDQDSITTSTRRFVPRLLQALEICEQTARAENRGDLLAELNRARLRAWTSLIHACALEGRRLEAWRAFRNSLRYGFSGQACLYFTAALAGPRLIALAKKLRQM